jgi:hypothetical protein
LHLDLVKGPERGVTHTTEFRFCPAKIESENLIGIGITGKHQGPSFNVFVTADEQREIAINLHQLNHTLPKIKIDKIIAGQLNFLPRPLIMRGRAEWNSNIKSLSDPVLINYEEWREAEVNNERWEQRGCKGTLLKCSKCNKVNPHFSLKPALFEVDRNIKCSHCGKQSMSKNWTCPCGTLWFICNKHKSCATDVPNIKVNMNESDRPKKLPKISQSNDQSEWNKNGNEIGDRNDNEISERPSKARKQQHGATIDGEGDPNLMVSHQQMLEEELKSENEKSLHPKNGRPKGDITLDSSEVVTKRPRVLGPKLSARFGVLLSELASKDGDNKAIQHHGEMVRKRGCENTSSPTKKPRCNGEFHPSEHGDPSNHATSSSSSL